MTDDYNLKLALMEKIVIDKSNPLIVDEIRDDSNLRFKILTKRLNKEIENDNNQEALFFGV
jgi:hypothetical protein